MSGYLAWFDAAVAERRCVAATNDPTTVLVYDGFGRLVDEVPAENSPCASAAPPGARRSPPPRATCDCGGHATGARRDGGGGHSTWCAVAGRP